MRRHTIAELQERIRTLEAYEEAYTLDRLGCRVVRLAAGHEDRCVEVELVGPHRASGGVVVEHDVPSKATDWIARALATGDAYRVDVVHQIYRVTREALENPVAYRGARERAYRGAAPATDNEETE